MRTQRVRRDRRVHLLRTDCGAGTQFVQAERVDLAGLAGAIAIGSFWSVHLVANNLRDIPTDTESGKITLIVRLGDANRTLHVIPAGRPFVATLLLILRTPWALLGLLALPLAIQANTLRSSGQGMALIPALRDTGLAMLVWGAATAVALSLA